MKAFEFTTIIKNDWIQVPDEFRKELMSKKEIRVIVLLDESESEEGQFRSLAQEQFFKGYEKSDSAYDSY